MPWRLTRGRAQKASAPSAGGSSPAAPSAPGRTMPPAGSSPSARITGSSSPAVPPSACPAVRVVSSPASGTDVLTLSDWAALALAPPELSNLDSSTMLAYPLWMAWPHAAGADCAVEMTAAQLRAILADRESHG